jgi:hypothetical protein
MPDKPQAKPGVKTQPPMPVWHKAPPELVVFYKELMADYPQLEQRVMFGYPCSFSNGYMVTGVFADRMILKLSPDDLPEFMRLPGAESFQPTPGRTFGTYVLVPEDIRTSDALEMWLQKALDYVGSLPPKIKIVKDKSKS